ncbi:hypothetical protein ACIFOT_01250 [Neobacillus sp. NRS-1170]|uniref:hypothetical protein n=1 Tax=Neobacillus sp. NRS-1170 TaxID=3233898 RepID=UPI003D2A58C0
MKNLQLPVVQLPEQAVKLRREVRAFIQEEKKKKNFEPICDSWLSGYSPELSRKLGERFVSGLNTVGKSSLMKSIYYCLGYSIIHCNSKLTHDSR